MNRRRPSHLVTADSGARVLCGLKRHEVRRVHIRYAAVHVARYDLAICDECLAVASGRFDLVDLADAIVAASEGSSGDG